MRQATFPEASFLNKMTRVENFYIGIAVLYAIRYKSLFNGINILLTGLGMRFASLRA